MVKRREEAVRRELAALYEERFVDFVRVATAIVGSELRAVDAVQESFARALASARSFRGEGPVGGWLWTILINTARSARRDRDRPPEDFEPTAEASNGHAADAAAVRLWVAGLPERQRLVVFLRYYADLDYRSIASVLAIEVGTVSATLSAAHTSLRRLMQEVPR